MKPKEVPFIAVDIHESDSGLFKKLEARKIGECVEKHMVTGDVAIRFGGYEIGMEIKRGEDFFNSLHSGRLHDQLYRLTVEYDFPVLVAEDVHDRKALRTLNRRVCVIPTDDMDDTIDLIESFVKDIKAKKFQYLRRKIVLIDDIDPQIKALCAWPNISVTRARELLDLFGTPENCFTHIKEWDEINGITDERLQKLIAIWSKEMPR